MTQVLMLGPLSADQMECVDLVKSSADSLLGVIDDILEFSTDTLTQNPEASEQFALRSLVEAEIASAAPLARSKGLDLHCSFDPNLAERFVGKPRWIKQVVSGVLNNAIKFTLAGEVEVTVKAENTSARQQLLEIAVKDTGIGIPPEKHAAIFEPFNQVDNSHSRRFGGTGLGLAIVRNLLHAMNGHVSLESEPGNGCTFRILIPLAIGAEELTPVLRREQPSHHRSSELLLSA